MIEKLTFIIPARNNKQYLQLAYKAIRDLKAVHDIIVLDDASTDGTADWVKSLQSDSNIFTYRNDGPERAGIARMFDKGVEMCKTDAFIAFHADMVVCPDFDEHIFRYLTPGTIVCATRVEPPLHPSGPEKITRNFGLEVEEFSFESWYEYAQTTSDKNRNKTTEGIFAPWAMYKSDFLKVGGHDLIFAPQSKEDSDIFNRFHLQGYKFIQSWQALVYHFTCRGSRFSPTAGGKTGENSPEWLHTTKKGMRNFIRKWGHLVKHDEYMKPVIPHKYDIAINVDVSMLDTDSAVNIISALEPFGVIYYLGDSKVKDLYIANEQKDTLYDLTKRVIHWTGKEPISHNVVFSIKTLKLSESSLRALNVLSEILDENYPLEPGAGWVVENEILVTINEGKASTVPVQPLTGDYLLVEHN